MVGGTGTAADGWLSSAELYDPITGTWTSAGSLAEARSSHTATLLPSGKVLVTGGVRIDASRNVITLDSSELYDPASGNWSATGSLANARYAHTATLLPSGKALVVGGSKYIGVLSSTELYDPTTGTWTESASLNRASGWHTATLLPSGRVLVAGGYFDNYNCLSRAELSDPGLDVDSN